MRRNISATNEQKTPRGRIRGRGRVDLKLRVYFYSYVQKREGVGQVRTTLMVRAWAMKNTADMRAVTPWRTKLLRLSRVRLDSRRYIAPSTPEWKHVWRQSPSYKGQYAGGHTHVYTSRERHKIYDHTYHT